MAKIMQLAKDLLKGGSKEDIYPKTLDTAVYVTNSSGAATDTTLKTAMESVDKTLFVTIDAQGNIQNDATVAEVINNVANDGNPVKMHAVLTVEPNTINYYFNLESCKTIAGVTTVVFSCIYSVNNSLNRMTATASTGDTKFTLERDTILTN